MSDPINTRNLAVGTRAMLGRSAEVEMMRAHRPDPTTVAPVGAKLISSALV